MKHHVKGKKLNRDIKHRKALFRNLAAALIENGSITTTEAKAKAVKPIVDKLFTKAKTASLHSRRLIGSFLPKRRLVNLLVDELAPNTGKRTSGFTRITKLGQRRGDNTMMVQLSLTDAKVTDPTLKSEATKAGSKKKSDTSKSDKKKKDSTPPKTEKPKNQPPKDHQTPKAPTLKRQQSTSIKKV